MTPTKEGSPAKAKPGKKDAIEKLNAQVLRTRQFAEDLRKQVATSLVEPAVAAKVTLRAALEAISGDLDRLRDTADMVSSGLHRLSKEKWAPAKLGKNALAPGDLVAIRDVRLARFGGAWDKADLKSLVVMSVHGARVKVQIHRDGLKGDCVGLVPAYWLQARAA